MNNFNNLRPPVGMTFGRWTVLDLPPVKKRGAYRWLCECECGAVKAIRPWALRNNQSRSCGCLQRESVRKQPKLVKHGRSASPEYRAWSAAKQRCFNVNHPAWPDYGGRGITMCQEWVDSFEAFFDHVGERPSSRHSIGRIDNNDHYEPGNVEWQTWREQNGNRRTTSAQGKGRKWLWRGKWRPA